MVKAPRAVLVLPRPHVDHGAEGGEVLGELGQPEGAEVTDVDGPTLLGEGREEERGGATGRMLLTRGFSS